MQTITRSYVQKGTVSRVGVIGFLTAVYVALLPVQLNIGAGLHPAPSDFVLVLIVGAYALGFGRFRIVQSSWSVFHFGMLLAFAAGTIVTILRNGDLSAYVFIQKDLGIVVLFLAYAVLVSFVDSWDRLRWLLRILVLSASFQNILYLALFFARRSTGFMIPGMDVGDARLEGMLIDANAYGGLLVLILSIHLITYYGREPLVPGMLGSVLTLSLAVGILLTYSRSSWIGAMILLLLVTALRPKTGVRLIAVSALSVFVVLQAMGPGYMEEMQGLATRESAGGRLLLIEQAMRMFWSNPAFGVGIGGFSQKFQIIIHNTTVWILVEMGVFGLIWFVGFLLWFVSRGIGSYRMCDTRHKPLALGLLAACLAMIGLSAGIEALYQRHWWFVLAMMSGVWPLARMELAAATKRVRGRAA